MKILIASDSYKEFKSSKKIGRLIQKGFSKKIDSKVISISDGGEGFLDALASNLNGELISRQVFDPLMRDTTSKYFKSSHLGIIEFSEACGVQKFEVGERHFMNSSSYGVGQLIFNAIMDGCTEIVVGLGGAATGDAGIGAAQALGVFFSGSNGKKLKKNGLSVIDIPKIHSADFTEAKNKFAGIKLTIVSDVTNPSTGKNGATFTFGMQKGAKRHYLKEIDTQIINYANNILNLKPDFINHSGTGAAGAFALSMKPLFDLKIDSGISYVVNKINFLKIAQEYDIIITGEGCFDKLSLNGKAPVFIAEMAKKLDKKVIGVFGQVKSMNDANNIFDIVVNTSYGLETDLTSSNFMKIEGKNRLINAGKKIESLI